MFGRMRRGYDAAVAGGNRDAGVNETAG